jgi:bifunctional oligoribonuclease and PAP phosphatase NrnA
MNAESLREAIESLNKEESFFIVSHYLPDGDSIGSSVALARALLNRGKSVFVYCRDPVPAKYKFIDEEGLVSSVPGDIKEEDTLIVLDCSDLTRTGLSEEQLKKFKMIINIDHHVTNENFGMINVVSEEAAATGEIIFELLCQGDFNIDRDTAAALYVAILTDTGSFKFENTAPRTHNIAADLLSYNLNPSIISLRVFDEKPLSYFMLLKKALSTLELYEDGKIASITISNEMLQQEGASMEMLDGMVNYAKNIDSVEIGILFYIEAGNEVKVGLRSKYTDVSIIAHKFHGGGHKRAAGFRANEPYAAIKQKTIEAASALLDEMKEKA